MPVSLVGSISLETPFSHAEEPFPPFLLRDQWVVETVRDVILQNRVPAHKSRSQMIIPLPFPSNYFHQRWLLAAVFPFFLLVSTSERTLSWLLNYELVPPVFSQLSISLVSEREYLSPCMHSVGDVNRDSWILLYGRCREGLSSAVV
jgi:hypothetical protein